ncbi:hypothetical protein B0O80DRAFT_485704 [Mortierella sp. GBAus27b]|nr:hypothetical protein BGX31_009852 [Mortierella sp. GBA43]KAI8357762.1 hypothetical protein B0O80DRAFT_485704 [Mortierella sp. GBAus27b]
MKILLALTVSALAISGAAAQRFGIRFDQIHYNPQEFKSGEPISVTYYGQALKVIDRDVILRTNFYDKNGLRIHRSVVNWCAVLEKYKGECPMKREDGFKLSVTHTFSTSATDQIQIESIVEDGNGNRLASEKDPIPVAK